MGKVSIYIGIFVLLFFSFDIKAQRNMPPVPEMRTCDAMEQDLENRAKYYNYSSIDELEVAIAQKIEEYTSLEARGRLQNEVYTLPIVVHVVHSGENVGSGKNLSFEQIQSQIEVLNEDFRRAVGTNGENDDPRGADIEIEFCLAALDEDGQELEEPGVHRYNGNREAWTRNEIEGILKPATIWDPNQYLNIWTVDFEGENELLLGYAQFPSESGLQGLGASGGASSTDGVVVRYTSFGSAEKGNFPIMQAPYNRGRTTTHEIGHFLGLRHIWGDGPCGSDDFVSDTPEQSGPTRGCPLGKASCGSNDMIANYMDYSDDACMNIFTQGQKARIRAVMELSPRRASLSNSSACAIAVTEIPTPDFRADKDLVLRDGTVRFTDLSTNFPDSWQWTFEGGSPSTSTERNPIVTYATEGIFRVSLTVGNSIGTAEPLVKEGFITVSSEGICNTLSNVVGDTETLPIKDIYRDTAIINPQGYLTGHNSLGLQAVSEFFINDLGYENLSAVNIRFGKAFSERDDARVTVVVWNARGPQNSPAAILDQQDVLIKQIQEDIANDRTTKIIFGGQVPLFGAAFQVGVLFQNYERGDTVVVQTTPDGVSTKATSWELNQYDEWTQYALSWGANIALDIEPEVGMNPSVQISSNNLIINPGQEIQINAAGASIFQWNADDGSISNALGPQIRVNPTQTTTYTVSGSGVDLCVEEARLTIFVRSVTGIRNELTGELSLYPNPTSDLATIRLINDEISAVNIQVWNALGRAIYKRSFRKTGKQLDATVPLSNQPPGMYIVQISQGDQQQVLKLIKQ